MTFGRATVGAVVVVALLVACSGGGGAAGGGAPDGGASAMDAPANETGKACGSSADCASNECVPLVGAALGSGGVCTTTCNGASDCVAGWSCEPSPGGPNLCECAPGAYEICDGKDDDCNGLVDDGPSADMACGNFQKCVAHACTCQKTVCGTDPATAGCVDTANDPTSCGACNAVCATNAVCVASACHCGTDATGDSCAGGGGRACEVDQRCHVTTDLSKSTTPGHVKKLALVGDSLFFGFGYTTDTAIVLLPKAGGTAVNVLGIDEAVLADVVTDGTDAFFSTTNYAASMNTGLANDTVYRCPALNCATSARVVLAAAQKSAPLALAGDYVYWGDKASGDLRRCAKAGCAMTPDTVAPTPAGAMAVNAILTDATSVYAVYANGLLGSAPLGIGGVVTTLAMGAAADASLDDQNVYFANWATGAVARCAKTGCNGAPTVMGTTPGPRAPVSDGKSLYWIAGPVAVAGGGTIYAAPANGSGAVAVADVAPGSAASPALALGLAVDATYLYFGGPSVLRMDK